MLQSITAISHLNSWTVVKNNISLLIILLLGFMLGCPLDHQTSQLKLDSTVSPKAAILSKLDSARKALEEGKLLLINEGKYKCCITEVCDACALAEFECYCYELLKEKKAVCFECYDGWQQGKGVDPKIKKEDVRMLRHVNACNIHAKPR